jgi:hypothetical protein
MTTNRKAARPPARVRVFEWPDKSETSRRPRTQRWKLPPSCPQRRSWPLILPELIPGGPRTRSQREAVKPASQRKMARAFTCLVGTPTARARRKQGAHLPPRLRRAARAAAQGAQDSATGTACRPPPPAHLYVCPDLCECVLVGCEPPTLTDYYTIQDGKRRTYLRASAAGVRSAATRTTQRARQLRRHVTACVSQLLCGGSARGQVVSRPSVAQGLLTGPAPAWTTSAARAARAAQVPHGARHIRA